MHGSGEKSMIPARVQADDCRASKSTDSVRLQPFTTSGSINVTQNVFVYVDHDLCTNLHGLRFILVLHRRCTNGRKLDEIFREQQIEAPIQRDAALLFESWKFAEINRAPEPPRNKA